MMVETFSADQSKALSMALHDIQFVDFMPNNTVPVVRCKDCKFYDIDEDGWFFCNCFGGLHQPDSGDFCSYGERKEVDG